MFGQASNLISTTLFEITGIISLDPTHQSSYLIDGIPIYVTKIGGDPANLTVNKYIGQRVTVKGHIDTFSDIYGDGGIKESGRIEDEVIAEDKLISLTAGFPAWSIFLLLGIALFMFKGKKK